MQAQRYRHRVEVQEQVASQDSETGDITHTWATVEIGGGSSSSGMPLSSVPAEVLRGPGREFDAADAKQAETTARINMRWFPGLLPTMRIVWQGQPFDILSIEADATDRREYRLRCREGVTDGS
jgi:SPP1 family predicted phage head-tail adaptor